MTILKKAFAVLTSCALMLSLAACNSDVYKRQGKNESFLKLSEGTSCKNEEFQQGVPFRILYKTRGENSCGTAEMYLI